MLGAYLEPCVEDVAVTSTKNLREVAQGESSAFSLRCMRDFMDTLLYVGHERDVGHIEHRLSAGLSSERLVGDALTSHKRVVSR